MSDDRIIDFNEIKNRVNEKDIDNFEGYMYDLFYKTQSGKMDLGEFSKNITEYMQKHNISEKKLLEIQKKMMERYGFDTSTMEENLKNMGIDLNLNSTVDGYENIRKKLSFKEKYNKKVLSKPVEEYSIENKNNKVKILLDNEQVTLISEKNIDLNDTELNEFLCSYKKIFEGKSLKITICSNSNMYEY